MPFKLFRVILIIGLFWNFIVRLILQSGERSVLVSPFSDTVLIFLSGIFNDLLFFSYFFIPIILYFSFIKQSLLARQWHKNFLFIMSFMMMIFFVFLGHSEWFFWEEFNTRFNFIAVDYLVYTNEVIGNIMESFPMGFVYASVLLISAVGFLIFEKWLLIELGRLEAKPFKLRMKQAGACLMVPVLSFFVLADVGHRISPNRVVDQLARNGLYEAFSAFRKNKLDYDEFYSKQDFETVLAGITQELTSVNGSAYVDVDGKQIRKIVNAGSEKRHNIVFILVESLSAKYLGTFGNKEGITPYLDNLAKESILFEQLYATGMRTVRGIEAVTLSLPPTPGYSVVKRPENENMFSMGALFKERGYDTKFLYGGFGYFDNMSYFFENNGFQSIDRSNFEPEEIIFSNIWGVSDEDLLNKTLQEADLSYANKRPFFNFVLTSSNHRPYTYPGGRIDIPSKTSREGAVKYTDYAIGNFIEKARQRPWFDDTIFVVIADHCSGGGGGKTDIPLKNYHIPMIVYAPKILKPKKVNTLSSQIDVAPTIMGLMNFSYLSKFFGKDILKMKPDEQRLVLGTYQNLGYFKDGTLVTLLPNGKAQYDSYDMATMSVRPSLDNKDRLNEAIQYYQYASYLLKNDLYRRDNF
jgi:phosphoglycerol transferase MdoB-like AlkP superfamily enzyme